MKRSRLTLKDRKEGLCIVNDGHPNMVVKFYDKECPLIRSVETSSEGMATYKASIGVLVRRWDKAYVKDKEVKGQWNCEERRVKWRLVTAVDVEMATVQLNKLLKEGQQLMESQWIAMARLAALKGE